MTLIKICGITGVQDALEVASLKVDMIGLVFAESSRRISPDIACKITATLRGLTRRPIITGVFVNEDPQTINRIARECGLDAVQLSGDESWERCRELELPAIKAVHIGPSMRAGDLVDEIRRGMEQAGRPLLCLLDSREDGKYGGTGRNFDWGIAGAVSKFVRVIIAGGLSPANVGEMIGKVRPLGVDVSSGVETDGRKDMAKIRAFLEIVRSLKGPTGNSRDLIEKYLLKGEKNVTR